MTTIIIGHFPFSGCCHWIEFETNRWWWFDLSRTNFVLAVAIFVLIRR